MFVECLQLVITNAFIPVCFAGDLGQLRSSSHLPQRAGTSPARNHSLRVAFFTAGKNGFSAQLDVGHQGVLLFPHDHSGEVLDDIRGQEARDDATMARA
jgi:hypothetical protein